MDAKRIKLQQRSETTAEERNSLQSRTPERNMKPTDLIRRNKIKLQHILMSDIHFAIQCVFEAKLLVQFEYINLKSISRPFDAATELVDRIMFKGETTCTSFLHLLQDTKLTDALPDLKTLPWYNPPSAPSTWPSLPLSKEEVEVTSCEHAAEHRLFCEDEQRVVCRICEPSHHPGHKLLPVEQALGRLKDQLNTDLRALKDKRTKHKNFQNVYNKEVLSYNEKQVEVTEKQIRAEFRKFHQFLMKEEDARVEALREEEKQKRQSVNRDLEIIEEQISSLSISISAVEQELNQHSVSLLNRHKNTRTSTRALCTLSDPRLDSGALIDVSKHLGNLSFRVWEKMKEVVKFAPVVLDPNTAAHCLSLSEDLTGVRYVDTWQQVPDNPERFSNASGVLGSEGFSSGKHSWEVKVGDHPCWVIGLAKESVIRKGERKSVSPEYGIWCLWQNDGRYNNGYTDLHTDISMQRNPERIRVQLDYEGGEVSFYDPEDMTHIYTHKCTFIDKLYPYFSIGPSGDAETTNIKVCEVPVMEGVLRSLT